MLDRHPLATTDPGADFEDCRLVERAVAGSREALHELVSRHQTFIFNVALKNSVLRSIFIVRFTMSKQYGRIAISCLPPTV